MASDVAIELSTPFDVLKGLQAELAVAQENVIEVGAPALRVALRKGEQDAERIINRFWNNIPTFVNEHTYTKDFNRRRLTGKVAASGRKIELRRFLSRAEMRKAYFAGQNWAPGFPRTKGVTVKAYRGSSPQVYPGTFVQQMKSGNLNIFKRTGRSRLPIKVQYAKEDMNFPLLAKLTEFENRAANVFAVELNKALDAQGF